MNRSCYKQTIAYAEDPYLGWITEKEEHPDGRVGGADPALLGPETDEQLQRAALLKLRDSYLILATEEGSIDRDALAWILQYTEKYSPVILYGDEDNITQCNLMNFSVPAPALRRDPFLKPDFSPDTLEDFFYMGGLIILREAEARETFGEELIPDERGIVSLEPRHYLPLARLALQTFAKQGAKAIVHIPHVLYHAWGDSSSRYDYPEADRDKITDCYKISRHGDLVTVVILSKDNPDMLLECIDALQRNADRAPEVIVVDNGSREEVRQRLEKELSKRWVAYVYRPMEFVYSALCNIGARLARGDFLLFMNDDVLIPEGTKDFPGCLLRRAARAHVGAVGIRLRYPDDTIQHVGISLLDAGPSHKLATYPDDVSYDRGRNRRTWNCLAVTGACLMVKKSRFEEVGGFDESIRISYTDVDLCMDLFEKGYYPVIVNDCFLYHHESVTRGRDTENEEKAGRLKQERERLTEKHPRLMKADPFYHPALTRLRLDYTPDYVCPWEDPTPACEPVTDVKLKAADEKHLLCCLDRVTRVISSFADRESYVEAEGWVILHHVDQTGCDPFVVLTDEKGVSRAYPAVKKYRKELPGVFPKEKNCLLSGFVIRMAEKEWNEKCFAENGLGVGVFTRSLTGKKTGSYRTLTIL